MFKKLHAALDGMDRKLEKLELILTLKDPGSSKAADAYEGLRRQVVASSGERVAHLAHLAQVDSAVQRGEGHDGLRLLLRDLMAQAGVERITDGSRREAFEIVDGEGDGLEVLQPAYIEPTTGRIVQLGRARAFSPVVAPASELQR